MPAPLRFFTLSSPVSSQFLDYVQAQGLLVQRVEEADFLLLPFSYELVHDYSTGELLQYGVDPCWLPELRSLAADMDQLSVHLNKKLIVFFYRDPDLALPFRNAIVFRTSLYKSRNRPFEFAMPAFIDHLPGTPEAEWQPTPWQARPSVSFRGQSAPLQLSLYQRCRARANELMESVGLPWRLRGWTRHYLLRRTALLALARGAAMGQLQLDKEIQPATARRQNNYEEYRQSLLRHHYVLCVTGHGNYSFRLYEVMREGRVPVLVDTDMVLPCPEKINWQQQCLWVQPRQLKHLPQLLQAFHRQLSADALASLQQQNRKSWQAFLSVDGFAQYLLQHKLPALKQQLQ